MYCVLYLSISHSNAQSKEDSFLRLFSVSNVINVSRYLCVRTYFILVCIVCFFFGWHIQWCSLYVVLCRLSDIDLESLYVSEDELDEAERSAEDIELKVNRSADEIDDITDVDYCPDPGEASDVEPDNTIVEVEVEQDSSDDDDEDDEDIPVNQIPVASVFAMADVPDDRKMYGQDGTVWSLDPFPVTQTKPHNKYQTQCKYLYIALHCIHISLLMCCFSFQFRWPYHNAS